MDVAWGMKRVPRPANKESKGQETYVAQGVKRASRPANKRQRSKKRAACEMHAALFRRD